MNRVEHFKRIALELCNLYEAKDKCYNNSFGDTYKKLGIISAVTRISDKFNRLCNLATNPDIDNLGESLEDTLRDMASYCIMTVMELENAKPIGLDMQGNILKRGDISYKCSIVIPEDAPILATLREEDKKIHKGDMFECIQHVVMDDGDEIRLATEEEKQKLFDIIKADGYKWNEETKTLEKLPKFKVRDVIVDIYKKHLHCDSGSGKISQITDDKYIFTDGSCIHIQNQDNWELVPNKFDISTLKSFDKVLCRHHKDNKWKATFFSHLDEDFHSHCYKFVTVSGSYPYMIPYEGNHHLLGTTNDCDNFYKTWEK